MPVAGFLNKEYALLKMRRAKYKECFDICVKDIKDIQFSLSVAKKGFEWHQKDRRIYYNLFTRLIETGDPDDRKMAIKILTKNSKHISYEKIPKNFKDDDELDQPLNTLFQSIFQNMESNLRKSLILKSLTDVEIINLKYEKFNFYKQFVEISDDPERPQGVTLCYECGKPIGDHAFAYDPERNIVIHSYHL